MYTCVCDLCRPLVKAATCNITNEHCPYNATVQQCTRMKQNKNQII